MWKNFIPNSTDEETVNNAFCTNGLFKISSESEVTVYPRVRSQIQNGKLLLCVDSSIILLEDENVMACNFLTFGALIDSLAVSNSGNVIICALADGNIHGIYVKGIPIFNLCVSGEDLSEGGTFAGIHQVEDSFYIMCRNGSIYRLFNIDEKLLETYSEDTVCENESRLYNESFLKNTMLEKVSAPKFCSVVSSFCFMCTQEANETEDSGPQSILGNERFLYFQDSKEYLQLPIPTSLEGMKMLYNLEHMIIGLSHSGHIFEICPYTKMLLHPFTANLDYLIDEFIVLENNEDIIELLLLTKPEQLGTRFMKIVEFPSMTCKNELSMPQHTWLVQQPKTAVNIYYLSGDDFNEFDLPQEIEMKIMCETQPQERLKKLICKGRLDEAEQFGRQFNLNLQPICEAKAKRKLLEISLLDENQYDEINRKFAEFLEICKTVESNEFVLSIRDSEIPSRSIMEKFLQEILSRLKDEKYHQNILHIKEQLLRLETLNIIDPYETNMQWQKFVHHPNIAKVCVLLFKTDMLSACIVWKRHAACIVPFLDVDSILKLLNAIPQSTEAFFVIQWLRYFIPSVLTTHPAAMSYLVEWSLQKTRSLQFSNHWPEVGLEFSTKILGIFEDVEFLYSDFRRQYDFNIDKLKAIVNALQDLSVLKKSYNLILTLDSYVKDTMDDTALRILQGVQLSNLKRVTSDFLCPIYSEKGKTPVIAIKKYINFLVSNRKKNTLWLERAVVSISMLHDEEEKLASALLVLKNSPVPWPDSVSPLVKLGNSSHPLAAEIQTQYDLQTIKILKAKYGWPLDSPDDHMKLVFRIIKLGHPEMINDINDLAKVCPEISSSANFYCCYELARKGQVNNAAQFLHNIDKKQRTECYDKITNIFTAIFSDPIDDSKDYDNLFEFLKVITPDGSKYNREMLLNLQHLHLLRKNFDLKVSPENLTCKLSRIEILSTGVDSIMKKLKECQTNIVHFMWTHVTELSILLNVEKMLGVLKLARKINKLEVSCALAYYALNVEEVSRANYEFYVDFAALLICQHIEAVSKEENFSTDPLAYALAYKLLVEGLKFGKLIQLEIIHFLNWIRIGYENYALSAIPDYYGDIDIIDKRIVDRLQRPATTPGQNGVPSKNVCEAICVFDKISEIPETVKYTNDPTPIIRCVSMALLALLKTNLENLPFRLNLFINPDIEISADEVRTTFLKYLEHLVKCKQHSSWYSIVQCTLKYQTTDPIIPKKMIVINKMKLYKFSLSQKEPNFIDLFSKLLADSNPEACLKYLENELKTGQPKLNYLILAEMYHTHMGDNDKISSDREQRMKYFYYTELVKHDSALKCKEFISISMLMKELKNKVLDVSLLKRMSYDFDWDYQQVLVSQIISLLSMQEPSYEIKTDAFEKEQITMKTSADQIRDMCQPYIKEITQTGHLASQLLNFITEINFYFYELYLCVIDILTYINSLPKEMELWANMLLFLKHKMVTKRRNRAGQIEMDWWLKSQPDIGVLPKIAKYRFPFMPLVQEPLKNILDCEVNVDNCESWFPLIKLHTVNQGKRTHNEIVQEQEYFCMSAVKNSISEYKQQDEETDTDVWHLQPINNAFLQSILRLTRHMTNASKTLFILYYVTNHAPDGADQVEAAAECYKFAVQNEKSLSENKKADETVKKIKRKYPLIKTQHLLHTYGLIDDKLLQLAENPKELIFMLYHHESILKTPKADINNLVMEISKLHNLDCHLMQVAVLQNWVTCTNSGDSIDGEETFYEDLNMSMNNIDTVNDEHIIRAHYILSSWETSKAIEFLIRHMFPVEGPTNTAKQLQIFECFSKLIGDSTASYMNIVSQKQYVILKCVHYLKQLGYNITVEKFAEYDKLNILKKIWQTHANNSLALEAISYICMGHKIFIPTIWNGVLKQMVNLNMVSKLNALVDVLSCEPSLLYTEGLVAAWECVLRAPFKNANQSRSYEQENILTKNLCRIQACPLVKQLNLIAFTEDCIRLDRLHMAAIFVALANKKQKELIIPLINQQKKEHLKQEIIDLEEAGISPTIINFSLRELKL